MPEDLLRKVKMSIPAPWKSCFLSALILGFIAHFYKITNWLPNWDSLVFRYDPQNMIALGRWFLPVVCAPSSFYDLPWITGLLSILLHGLGAVCICAMFGIRKNTTAAMIGAAVITFPTVTSVLMYNYVSDGYAIAFLLSCLAALFLAAEKPRYIAAVLCIALSAGIYQAYITVTVMLLLAYLILQTLQKESDALHLLIKSVKILAAGIAGMVLYYGVLTALLKITGTSLLEYQGLNSAASLSGIDIRSTLYTIKNTLLSYFFDFSNGLSVFCVLNVLIFAVTALLYLADLLQNRPGPAKLCLLCVYVLFLPLGSCILAFINSHIDYHNLMKMGFFVFYLFFLLQYEKLDFAQPKLKSIKAWTLFAIAVLLIGDNAVLANVSYHKLDMAYEKSYGTLIRIADRIEQTAGAEDCSRILVLGTLAGSEAYSVNLPPDMTGTTDGYILRFDDEVVGQSVLCSALNDYCGKNYTFLAGEEKDALLEKIQEEDMGIWPASDSILVTDHVIVIRLGNEVQ